VALTKMILEPDFLAFRSI